MGIREEARAALRVYQSRTGLTLKAIAEHTNFSWYSMRHLASGVDYGKDGEGIAQATIQFIREHPPITLQIPGRLYETQATHAMDNLLRDCVEGCWGTLYGPAGAQKTYLLEYRAAEAAADPEPWMLLVDIPGPLTPCMILTRIATALGAPYAQSSEGLRTSIQYHVRTRKTPLVVVFDEAQLLYKSVEALESVRRLADSLPVRPGRSGLGLVMVGNERLLDLFKPRRGSYFEQWRSRIEQRSVCVSGPSKAEAREMVSGELGEDIKMQTAEMIVGESLVKDPATEKWYVSVRKLFNSLRDFSRKRGNGRTQ